MGDQIFKELILTIEPYTLSILGAEPTHYFFRVHGTVTDYSSVSEILAELTRHILALKKLRDAVEDEYES